MNNEPRSLTTPLISECERKAPSWQSKIKQFNYFSFVPYYEENLKHFRSARGGVARREITAKAIRKFIEHDFFNKNSARISLLNGKSVCSHNESVRDLMHSQFALTYCDRKFARRVRSPSPFKTNKL